MSTNQFFLNGSMLLLGLGQVGLESLLIGLLGLDLLARSSWSLCSHSSHGVGSSQTDDAMRRDAERCCGVRASV